MVVRVVQSVSFDGQVWLLIFTVKKSCCSFVLHVLASLICIVLVSRQLVRTA